MPPIWNAKFFHRLNVIEVKKLASITLAHHVQIVRIQVISFECDRFPCEHEHSCKNSGQLFSGEELQARKTNDVVKLSRFLFKKINWKSKFFGGVELHTISSSCMGPIRIGC